MPSQKAAIAQDVCTLTPLPLSVEGILSIFRGDLWPELQWGPPSHSLAEPLSSL